MTSFDQVWKRIRAQEGRQYVTKRGREFTYSIDKQRLYPDRTIYSISKNDFKKAYRVVPLDGPNGISNEVRGPSYVWAILHDKRISLGEW
jgi:hypothetical protein